MELGLISILLLDDDLCNPRFISFHISWRKSWRRNSEHRIIIIHHLIQE